MAIYDTKTLNTYTLENKFLKKKMDKDTRIPSFKDSCGLLPEPVWEGREDVVECYWKTWEMAFHNLRLPKEENGFITSYIDTAFNDCLFMWDSVFILMFGRYGSRAFHFQNTLDNFYKKQHKDGYICRQIRVTDGKEGFDSFDPSSTGPNIMAWSEWEYYLNFGDKERLSEVFPVLLAYTQWFKKHRTWKDGSYWSSGWGCGMDNQPRLDAEYSSDFDHGHISWVDITMQQILSNKILVRMANALERHEELDLLLGEIRDLENYVNQHMWDEASGFYYDVKQSGERSQVKTIGSYWALLADVVPESKLNKFIAHLTNKDEFSRTHMIPSLSADHEEYEMDGHYWKGGVWSPTNYMVLRGLSKYNYQAMAHNIAKNHLENVVEVYKQTGTLWENYAPEYIQKGNPAKPNFVGWTGITPISIFIEYLLGIQPNVGENKIYWNVSLIEKHGIKRYPFGENQTVDLICNERESKEQEPEIYVQSTAPVDVVVRWGEKEKLIRS